MAVEEKAQLDEAETPKALTLTKEQLQDAFLTPAKKTPPTPPEPTKSEVASDVLKLI